MIFKDGPFPLPSEEYQSKQRAHQGDQLRPADICRCPCCKQAVPTPTTSNEWTYEEILAREG